MSQQRTGPRKLFQGRKTGLGTPQPLEPGSRSFCESRDARDARDALLLLQPAVICRLPYLSMALG